MAAAAPARKKPAPRTAKGTGHRAQGTRAARNSQALQRARSAHQTKARTAPARRKSGPVARPKAAPRPAPRAPRTVARPLARAAQSGGSVVLDRLLRGRAWVVLIGVLLAGIVFLNVSVLELNRGIAQTDTAAEKLERKNSVLRERVAALDSTERIQERAEARGLVLPPPGEVTYLKPNRERDARLAATRIESTHETVAAAPAPEQMAPTEPVATTTPPPSATPPSADPALIPTATAEPAVP